MKPLHRWIAVSASAMALSGCVPAGMLLGAGAVAVHTASQERAPLDTVRDADILLTLNSRYLEHSAELFSNVAISVVEGRVVLTGSVPERIDRVAATEIAWATSGVTSVTDEMTVRAGGDAIDYAEDALISNQLRLALVADTSISSVNYSVETVDKIVHITGLARNPDELGRVIEQATVIPGVVTVVSHVLTVDDPRRTAMLTGTGQGAG
ncbi:MAG: BON domain-containing protein [Pseudomonadota bacterium]